MLKCPWNRVLSGDREWRSSDWLLVITLIVFLIILANV